MFLVSMDVELLADPPATREDITDLIEAVIDDLDATVLDPSISTVGVGAVFHMIIEARIPIADETEAFEAAKSAMWAALHVGGVNRRDHMSSGAETTRVLQDA